MFLFLILLLFYHSNIDCFPYHDQNEDRMINPVWDDRDNKACGLFNPGQGRSYLGTQPYDGN